MQFRKLNLLFFLLIYFLISNACQQPTDSSDAPFNKYLKNLPSVSKKHAEIFREKTDSLHQCVDIDTAWRLKNEINNINQQWQEQNEREKQQINAQTTLPFHQSAKSSPYILSIQIDKERISPNYIGIIFIANLPLSTPPNNTGNCEIYYYATNQKNKRITGTLNHCINSTKTQNTETLTTSVKGLLGPLENLGNLCSITIISKDEYLELSK